jgi:hypothetical protein
MLGSDDMSIKVQDILLRIDDEQMFVELARTLRVLEERERKINETLAELLYQVDELLNRFDSLGNAESEEDSNDHFLR